MLRKVFYKKSNHFTQRRRVQASTSYDAKTSTPKESARRCACECTAAPPNVPTIERSTSAPILVSDSSIADLERHFKKSIKKCSPSKSSLRTSSSSGCKQSPRVSIKEEPVSHCAQVQAPLSEDKSGCVEELYFNCEAKKSGGSSPGGHCISECTGTREEKLVCSSLMTKIEKEVLNRSCGRIVKDSSGMCSLVESVSATCDANMCAQYYQNKLMSTLQILQNKEETIRVQAQSLAVAEARITALNDRTFDLKRDLDRRNKEYQQLLKSVDLCTVEKSDVCIVTDKQIEDQSDLVNTLQNNLSVIEELYRECFYETAKQESLIDMLRSSYLDVRLMERQKADQIGRLQTVIDTQKWSLDRCQDIALEVDSLKMEISNFLHSATSTNNDSGMWERSEDSFASAPGVQDELHDVTELLLRLRDLLTVECECNLKEENMKLQQKIELLERSIPCTCGLQEENMELKKEVDILQKIVDEMRAKICELECTLVGKSSADSKHKAEIEAKQKELSCIKSQLLALEDCARDQSSACDALTMKLTNLEDLLDEKNTEVAELQKQNEAQAKTIKDLQEELAKADQLIGENCKMRSEVAYLNNQVSLWREQLNDSERRVRALEQELARCREHCEHINECYREKASNVAELQAHLEEAHARGTALCGEARHAVCAVRHWMRRMRDKHREQENLMKEKDAVLTDLQQRLEERRSESQHTSTSENTANCSKCLSSRDARRFCSKTGERQKKVRLPNACELPTCSSTPASTAPGRVWVLRKKSGPHKPRRTSMNWMLDAAMQEPIRQDAGNSPPLIPSDVSAAPSCSSGPPAPRYCSHREVRPVRVMLDRPPRDVSPTEQLLLRVEQLTEAMADGQRRWARPHDAR